MREFVYSILIIACVVTFLWERNVQRTVHGSVAVDFCTDCPQFYEWLRENG